MRPIDVGDPVPDIALPSQSGEEVSLGQFRGRRRRPLLLSQGRDRGLHQGGVLVPRRLRRVRRGRRRCPRRQRRLGRVAPRVRRPASAAVHPAVRRLGQPAQGVRRSQDPRRPARPGHLRHRPRRHRPPRLQFPTRRRPPRPGSVGDGQAVGGRGGPGLTLDNASADRHSSRPWQAPLSIGISAGVLVMQLSRRNAVKALLATTAGGLAPAGMAVASEKSGDTGSIEEIKTEVCVIGGGSGGVGAALAAARAGARGAPDRVGVDPRRDVHQCLGPHLGADGRRGRPPARSLRADEARPARRHRCRLRSRGAAARRSRSALRAAGVRLRRSRDARRDGQLHHAVGDHLLRARVRGDRLDAVEAWFAAKRLVIEADVFIDCTADGDVSADAGCEYHMGEDPKSRYDEPSAPENAEMSLNGLTLCYRITDTGVKQKPYLPKGVEEGICPRPAHIVAMPNGDHLVNAVNMIDGNAVLCRAVQRTDARGPSPRAGAFPLAAKPRPGRHFPHHPIRSRQGLWDLDHLGHRSADRSPGDPADPGRLRAQRERLPGRTSRNQKHKDIIAITDHAVDIHGRKGRLYEVPNGPYGVPYRCLLPRGVRQPDDRQPGRQFLPRRRVELPAVPHDDDPRPSRRQRRGHVRPGARRAPRAGRQQTATGTAIAGRRDIGVRPPAGHLGSQVAIVGESRPWTWHPRFRVSRKTCRRERRDASDRFSPSS